MNTKVNAASFSFTAPERNQGANIRADKFPSPYTAVEHTLEDHTFMTTVEKDFSGYHIFFLHGGGCVMEAVSFHADVVKKLADQGHRVTIFDYPLAPEHQFEEIQESVYNAYQELKKLYPQDLFAVYGDSSGGGLGLALLMRLRDEGCQTRPEKAVWVSPAVDLTMSNPEIQKYRSIDRSLNFEGSIAAGKAYIGDADPHDPRISPLYGNMEDLGEMLLFYGENELLRPDCELFAQKVEKSSGCKIQAFMGQNMYHDYLMMVSFPESVKAFEAIQAFLKK